MAIVDGGFKDYQAAMAANDLPSTTTVVNSECTDADGSSTLEDDDHGTAVSEIVHQEAPKASLVLYCVRTVIGMAKAARDIQSRGIKIVNMSLGIPGDARGDGTGADDGTGTEPVSTVTAAGVVRKSRQAGVLWVVAAGNDAADHWSGQLTDTDRDGYVDIDGVYDEDAGTYENDQFYVGGGSQAAPSVASVVAQWDSWPTASQNVLLQLTGFQCTRQYDEAGDCGAYPITLDSDGLPEPTSDGLPQSVRIGPDDARPVAGTYLANFSNFEQIWNVDLIVRAGGDPSTRYDLTYGGAVAGPSANACTGFDLNGNCSDISPRSSQGSVSSPANSPFALAVGAASAGVDGTELGKLRLYSSQGPTIDGRVKPEVTAYDGVTSPVFGAASTDPAANTGFYGTSAAAPHVAGAAALIKSAAPGLDASGIQRALTDRASHPSGGQIVPGPISPPSNAYGAGLLTLGAPPESPAELAPQGARYTPITATRLIDTRVTQQRLGAGGTVTVPVPGIPDDVTAVAVNLTGVNAAGSSATFLTAYPGTVAPPTSNLNLSATDPTAAIFAIVRVDRSGTTPTLTVRNSRGTVDVVVDLLGYFGTGDEQGRLTTLATPKRVLDTRSALGGHQRPVRSRESVQVSPAVATGATAALVNLTVAVPGRSGYLTAAATCPGANAPLSTSLLNYGRYSRSNLAIVPLDSSGRLCLTNYGGDVNAVVDVLGYLSAGSGSAYYALPSAQRIVDSRTGNGGNGGGRSSVPIGAARRAAFVGSGVGVIPASASALLANVVEANNTAGGYLTFQPGTAATGTSSTVGFSPGRVVANAAVVGLANRFFSVYNASGTVNFATDVAGYFAPDAG